MKRSMLRMKATKRSLSIITKKKMENRASLCLMINLSEQEKLGILFPIHGAIWMGM